MEESFGIGKKSYGTETDTETWSWFWLPIPKPGFGRTLVSNIYENSAWGKTSGNFGGFLIGNNILSDLGISIGNPDDASWCVLFLKPTYYNYTQVVELPTSKVI